MEVSSIQFNNSNNTAFRGSVKSSFLYNDCAKEYAKGVKVLDDEWYKLRLFINTVRAIKNDGTKNELVIDTLADSKGKNWYVKYGDYFIKSKTVIDNPKEISYSQKKSLGKEAFGLVIQLGKDCFGIRNINSPIKEFSSINENLKRATNYEYHARLPKNKYVMEKLISKAEKEKKKAEETVAGIKTEVLKNL